MTNGWFSSIKIVLPSWLFTINMGGFESCFFFPLMNKTFLLVLACSLGVGTTAVGTIIGAIKGLISETGVLRGAGIGAVSGAIATFQFMESTAHGESFSKVDLLLSLMNEKFFQEWASNVVEESYQLEDFKNGDSTRILPSCGHSFHLWCIDEWLIHHGTCPICRKDV